MIDEQVIQKLKRKVWDLNFWLEKACRENGLKIECNTTVRAAPPFAPCITVRIAKELAHIGDINREA